VSRAAAVRQRWVIKVGSSLVTNEGRGLDRRAMANWADQIAALKRDGIECVLVSSGAIAEGVKRLGWTSRPAQIHELQAAAAIGQMGLVEAYQSAFAPHGLNCAQILLTHEDLAVRMRYLNARSTLVTLLQLDVVPIINENDTVITDEIKVGDNDTLGALVANLLEADLLVILTDQAGLYDADPRHAPGAALVRSGRAGDVQLEAMAGGAGSAMGKGGMLTKVLAAKRAAMGGASTVIASGRDSDVLLRLARGESVGTKLDATVTRVSARKQWMADHLQVAGSVLLDDGAVHALLSGGRSLLSVGVKGVTGDFARGDVIDCRAANGRAIGRGIVNYGSADVRRIAGHSSQEIEALLGFIEEPELIHRDNFVLL
jgi:glutamate 5-kinase